ncbi:MAG: hypothetical protein R2932_39580 [Caldilineaceae bacterium]
MFSHFRLMNDLALSHTWCAHITDWGVGAMLFHVVLLESRGLTRFGFDMLCPTPCDPVEPSMLTIVIIICIHVVNIHTLFCHNLILVDCIMLFSGNYGVSGKLKSAVALKTIEIASSTSGSNYRFQTELTLEIGARFGTVKSFPAIQ